MDLTFLGAATTVTGSQFLLETGQARILVDCGMFQGGPNEAIRNRIPRGYDPAALDAMLLTHAHLDHCGLIPVVVREGFRGPIRATAGTIELARLVLLDSGRLQEEFAKREARFERRKPEKAASEDAREHRRFEALIAEATVAAAGDAEAELRAQPAAIETDLDEPLYTEDDAVAALRSFRPIRYDVEEEVAPGIKATFLDAGHILGSAIIRLRVTDVSGSPERVIVFSGDLGKRDTPIIRDPTRVTEADYVLCESTYGGREHEPESEARRVLAEVVRLVAENDGVLLIPSFAIGRTQELTWALDRLISAGEIPALPLYLDSPMAREATSIYRQHAEYYDEETRKLLESGDTPLDYPGQRIVKTIDESRAIARAPRPYMIVASNGMLTGGRVVGHLRELIDDPRAVILFVGYQGEGTLGRHLQDGATTVRLDGAVRQVRCKVRAVSGFSAHADEPELLDWLAGFAAGRSAGGPGFPRRVFLVHGDPGPQAELAPKVTALGFDVYVPHWRETVTLV
jgi:metallo-beta-lactamase family protein